MLLKEWMPTAMKKRKKLKMNRPDMTHNAQKMLHRLAIILGTHAALYNSSKLPKTSMVFGIGVWVGVVEDIVVSAPVANDEFCI